MARTHKSKKQKVTKKTAKKIEKKPKSKKAEKALATQSADSDSDSGSDRLQKLLEPYSKDQLIDFISEAASLDPALFQRIRETADRDVSHRKIFVHGLGWNTTRESLVAAFESYGQIEDCNVVTDRITGKAKGYGFVLFKTRQGAVKALKEPGKKINNRLTQSQLAAIGPPAPALQSKDTVGRKIYVSNVHADVDPERLRSFFAKFGEIESGPIGFNMQTGKSRGFALFVYKSEEGARKALEEPYRMFEGHQLHCQKATEGKNKVPSQTQSQSQPQLAAVSGTQNLMLNQHPTLNTMYNGLLANSNAGLIAPGSANPAVAGTMYPAVIPPTQVGSLAGGVAGLVGYGAHGMPSFGVTSSVLGAPGLGLQHAYPSTQLGQSAIGRGQGAGGGFGAFSGYSSYMCVGCQTP